MKIPLVDEKAKPEESPPIVPKNEPEKRKQKRRCINSKKKSKCICCKLNYKDWFQRLLQLILYIYYTFHFYSIVISSTNEQINLIASYVTIFSIPGFGIPLNILK